MPKDNYKKDAIAFYGFRPGAGGVSPVMFNLMTGMVQKGYPVHQLIGRRFADDYRPLLKAPDVITIDDRSPRLTIASLGAYYLRYRPVALLAVREWAVRHAIRARRKTRFPVKVVIRVGTNNSVSIKRRHLFQRFIRRYRLRKYYYLVDDVIAVNRRVAIDTAGITRLPDEKIHVIPNPTIPMDLAAREQVPVDHRWLSPKTVPVIMGMGRLARPKDFFTLIRSFAKVKEKTDCRLIILGEGKMRVALETLVDRLGLSEVIDMPGHVDNPFAYLARADLFVLTSIWEGSPNVLIEAMAVGTPVISTDCAYGPSEILDNGRYGPLVPVGDFDGLAKRICEVLKNPLPETILRAAVSKFKTEKIIPLYLKTLRVDA